MNLYVKCKTLYTCDSIFYVYIKCNVQKTVALIKKNAHGNKIAQNV